MLRENELFNKLNDTQRDTVKRIVSSCESFLKDKDCELVIEESDSVHVVNRIVITYDNEEDVVTSTTLTVEDIDRR